MVADASPCTVSGEGGGPWGDVVDEVSWATVLPVRFPGGTTLPPFAVAPAESFDKASSSGAPILFKGIAKRFCSAPVVLKLAFGLRALKGIQSSKLGSSEDSTIDVGQMIAGIAGCREQQVGTINTEQNGRSASQSPRLGKFM